MKDLIDFRAYEWADQHPGQPFDVPANLPEDLDMLPEYMDASPDEQMQMQETYEDRVVAAVARLNDLYKSDEATFWDELDSYFGTKKKMSKKNKAAAKTVVVVEENVEEKLHESDVKRAVLDLLGSWGTRTTYRYLRDHGLLETFEELLPCRYEEAGEDLIRVTLQSIWDDFTPEALQELRTWMKAAAEGALGVRMAVYASHLHKNGHVEEAYEVLQMAATVDRKQQAETVEILARDLKVNDVVQSIADTVGFTDLHHPGRIASITAGPDALQLNVHVPQADTSVDCSVPLTASVKVLRLQRPRYSRSLRSSALAKLQKVEASLESRPDVQSRVSRLRYMLEELLKQG